MCRVSASLFPHKSDSDAFYFPREFGVEWHGDFNKEFFNEIYGVAKWCDGGWCTDAIQRHSVKRSFGEQRTHHLHNDDAIVVHFVRWQYGNSIVDIGQWHGVPQFNIETHHRIFHSLSPAFDWFDVPLTLKRFMALIRRCESEWEEKGGERKSEHDCRVCTGIVCHSTNGFRWDKPSNVDLWFSFSVATAVAVAKDISISQHVIDEWNDIEIRLVFGMTSFRVYLPPLERMRERESTYDLRRNGKYGSRFSQTQL